MDKRLVAGLVIMGAIAGCEPPACASTACDPDCPPFQRCNVESCTCEPIPCAEQESALCVEDSDCAVGSYCSPTSCDCVPSECDAADECDEDADCPVRCDYATCTCEEVPSPLSPENVEALTTGGLTGHCTFTEERDCAVGTFEADLTFRVSGGTAEIVQLPGSQTTTGSLGAGVTFYTRDATGSYDELYLAEVTRTPGADPTSPLTPETVQVRALNASGAEGSLAPIDEARLTTALGAGAQTGDAAAIDALLAGTSGICTYNVICAFGP